MYAQGKLSEDYDGILETAPLQLYISSHRLQIVFFLQKQLLNKKQTDALFYKNKRIFFYKNNHSLNKKQANANPNL